MSQVFTQYIPALLAGIILGLFYFGGLWLTCRYLPHFKRPVLLFFGSFVVRSAVVVLALVFLVGKRWDLLLIALGGIILVRAVMIGKVRKQTITQTVDLEEKSLDGNQSG